MFSRETELLFPTFRTTEELPTFGLSSSTALINSGIWRPTRALISAISLCIANLLRIPRITESPVTHNPVLFSEKTVSGSSSSGFTSTIID